MHSNFSIYIKGIDWKYHGEKAYPSEAYRDGWESSESEVRKRNGFDVGHLGPAALHFSSNSLQEISQPQN